MTSFHPLADSHTHIDMMAFAGYEELALMGVTHAVTHACVFGASGAASCRDQAKKLLTRHRQTAADHLIDLRVCLGVHPLGIPPDWEELVSELPQALKQEGVAGIGEVGLHTASEVEQECLLAQLKVAAQGNWPVSIHLPPYEPGKGGRDPVVRRILELMAEAKLDPGLACIEHVDLDVARLVNESGCWLGLSLGPGRLDAKKLAENGKNLYRRGMLSSDYVNFLPRDWCAVPRAVLGLRKLKADEGFIRAIGWENAREFYRLG